MFRMERTINNSNGEKMGIFGEYKWHYQDWSEGFIIGFVAGGLIIGIVVTLILLK